MKELIRKTEELIELSLKKVELLKEMREIFVIAEACGVNPEEILKCTYAAPTRGEYEKWSEDAKRKVRWYSLRGPDAMNPEGIRIRNKIVLKSGDEIWLEEPIFLKYEGEIDAK